MNEHIDRDGKAVASFALDKDRTVSAFQAPVSGHVVVPFSLAEAYRAYTEELWVSAANRRALPPGILRAFYGVKRAIPANLQLLGRRALIRWQGKPEFPSWPYDSSVAELLKLYVRFVLLGTGRSELKFRWFWPGGARAAAILTHDVESGAGLRNALRIADVEQARGLRSSFNIVAAQYPVDRGIVAELQTRGFEIGVHGVRHDRSMFSSRASFEEQRAPLQAAIEEFGAEGFRSPSTYRVHRWLAELPVSYDCTIPLSDPYEPQPGGCCSPWPFFLGEVVELPYTLPQDHLLFTLMGHRTVDVWLRQLDALEQTYGLVQCLSHPDPGYLGDPQKESLYADFLDALAARPGLWHALPREVAQWWRSRDAAEGPVTLAETGVAYLDQDKRVTIQPPGSTR